MNDHASTPATYELFGLRIRSEIPFPAPTVEGPVVDVDVRWVEPRTVPAEAPAGQRLAGLTVEKRIYSSAVRDDEGYLFRFCEVCDVRISPGLDNVAVAPDPIGPVDMVPVFLAGNVLALLLTLRDIEVLHGSAVELDGAAVAFVGHTNAGKSTLAGEACAVGASLVADDVLALEISEAARCLRGGPQLRLRPGVTELAERLAPDANVTADGRSAVAVEPSTLRPALRAVVLPRVVAADDFDADAAINGGGGVRLRRLEPKAAFQALFPYHRLTGLTDPGAVRRHFHACVDLSRLVPVLHLDMARGGAGPAASLALSLCRQGDQPA
jgi:hypothetical protein